MRLLLLADTHVPTRARELSADVWAHVEAADLVLDKVPLAQVLSAL